MLRETAEYLTQRGKVLDEHSGSRSDGKKGKAHGQERPWRRSSLGSKKSRGNHHGSQIKESRREEKKPQVLAAGRPVIRGERGPRSNLKREKEEAVTTREESSCQSRRHQGLDELHESGDVQKRTAGRAQRARPQRRTMPPRLDGGRKERGGQAPEPHIFRAGQKTVSGEMASVKKKKTGKN